MTRRSRPLAISVLVILVAAALLALPASSQTASWIRRMRASSRAS